MVMMLMDFLEDTFDRVRDFCFPFVVFSLWLLAVCGLYTACRDTLRLIA